MAPTWTDHASPEPDAADVKRRTAAPARADEPTIVTAADPRLRHGSGAAAVVAMQRSAGNAAVSSLLAGRPVQRDVTIGEMNSTVDITERDSSLSPEIAAALPAIISAVRSQASPGPGSAADAAPASAAADAAPASADPTSAAVTSDGGTTTIRGGVVNIEAAMTHASGVVQADTVIAQNVVGSNYTPGAGNVW